jgi:hypothetical protein
MNSFKNCWLLWLAGFVFSATALAQSSTIDPNDPVLKTLRDAQASELLPLKDYCLKNTRSLQARSTRNYEHDCKPCTEPITQPRLENF